MKTIVLSVVAALLAGGCQSNATTHPWPRPMSCTHNPAQLLEVHDILSDDLSELATAYRKSNDPDAREEQKQDAMLRVHTILMSLQVFDDSTQAHLAEVREILLRKYEAETNRTYDSANSSD